MAISSLPKVAGVPQVVGATWLDNQALALVSEQGPRSHLDLYDASGKQNMLMSSLSMNCGDEIHCWDADEKVCLAIWKSCQCNLVVHHQLCCRNCFCCAVLRSPAACAVAGSLIKEHAVFEDSLMGSQHITNSEGIPEQAYHTALAVTLDRLLLLGSQGIASHQIFVC